MGCDVLDALDTRTDIQRGARRIVFPAHRLSFPLETIADNAARVAAAPLRVLATCSGCNFVYCTIRNLGFSVKHWTSIEIDPACRAVTANIVPRAQLQEPCHDALRRQPPARSALSQSRILI